MLQIDPQDPTPPFEQIRAAIVAAAAEGIMPAGTRLPTVRGLAAELGLAAGTVAKAYRQLETDGVIETHGRSGSVIAARADSARQQIELAAREFAQRVGRVGMDREEALALVAAALGSGGTR